ncbi:hypothetical protein C8R44DRAFT_880790 [Mycena epipterygia]|nr:hypothetical protein C8R44DRAFT_880790 [Mycena epipterygia]
MVREVRLEQGFTPLAPILCVPEFFPHPTHTHSIRAHGEDADCMFFAVLTGDESGIYTHFSQVQAILDTDPYMEYIAHGCWIGITGNWRRHCGEHHVHEWPRSSSRSSSPLYSASAFDISPCSSPSPSRTPSPEHPPFSKAIPFFDGPSANAVPKRPLLSTGPSPAKAALSPPASPAKMAKVPTRSAPLSPTKHATVRPSSSRISTAFSASRALGPLPADFPRPVYSSEPTSLPFPARLLPELGGFPADPVLACHRTSPPGYEEQGEASTGMAAANPTETSPAIYAVSQSFSRREQALQVFEETEGAQMLFARSVGEVAEFFKTTENPSASGSNTTSTYMYAVSGHRVAFRNRESAFRVFLQDGAEMLFSKRSSDIAAFIRQHASI